jgi:deoxyribonuclease-4
MDKSIRFGFHTSVAGALCNAPLEASRYGYGAFQIFASSSRSWKTSPIAVDDAVLFRKYVKSTDTLPFVHIPYLCNPSSPEPEVHRHSAEMLSDNIRRCDSLGISDLVIHLGSHKGKGIKYGIDTAVQTIAAAIDRTGTKKVRILLENGAGYSNSVGSKMEEIGSIISSLPSEKIGLCLDTCHAFAAGYDLRDAESVDRLANLIESQIGTSKIGLTHLNDSKYELGSGLDRHYYLGRGFIGIGGLQLFMENSAFSKGSFIMETPVAEDGTHEGDLSAAESIARAAKLQITRSRPLRQQ